MDRRQRKTRKAIFTAFEELASEQHYSSITVGQIIERADIGRSTFYAHFSTKDELLDQICAELFAHVFEGVETIPHSHPKLQPNLQGTLAHLLDHLRSSHRGIGAKLLAEREPHFTNRFCELLSEFFAPRLPERSSWVPRNLMQELVVSSFCQAVSWWYEHGYEADPEQLSHWYLRTLGWDVHAPQGVEATES